MPVGLDSAWSGTQQLGLHSATNMFLPRQLVAPCIQTEKVWSISSN